MPESDLQERPQRDSLEGRESSHLLLKSGRKSVRRILQKVKHSAAHSDSASEETFENKRSFEAKTDAYLGKHPLEGDPERRRVQIQEALMTCRTLIESHIEQEHPRDESRKKLKQMVETFEMNYHFTPEQTGITNDLIDEYYDRRQEAQGLRDRYSDDRELVRNVTGVNIAEDAHVRVSVGPWGLVIVGDNALTNTILYRGEMPPTDFVAGGLADVDHVPPFLLLNEGNYDPKTQRHEEQHLRYAITKSIYKRHKIDISGADVLSEMTVPPQEGQTEDFLENQRKFALDRVKDEIFAYSFNENHFPIELFTNASGNPYDYLKTQREWYGKDPLYRQASQKVLVSDYNAIISSAVASFDLLMRKGRYSNKEAIALLAGLPLEQWNLSVREIFALKNIELSQKEGSSLSKAPLPDHSYERRPKRKAFSRFFKEQQPIDVVITQEETQENVYFERMKEEARKKAEETHSVSEESGENVSTDEITFSMVNKLLYDRTCSVIEQRYKGQDLREYFEILDKVTSERTEAFLASGKFDDQDILFAVGIVFNQLKVPKGN